MPRRERPLGPGDDVVLRFAAGLRRLRENAGGPTYRELSVRAGYSAAALSDAASGRKLPGLALTTAYVTACEGDADEWETRWRSVAAELAAAGGEPEPIAETTNPYLGLAAFQAGDASRFFGREKLIAELTAKVEGRRFVGVFGSSGSGKSSLLRAGLVGAHGPSWTMVFTPGAHPMEQCAAGLASTGHVLIIDQFEEIFTLCHDEERAEFLDALLALAEDEHGTRVVIGVRADFYGHCGRHAGLVDALRDAQVMVGPMNADELRTVIVEPAVRVGYRVESALVTRLVTDAIGQPAVLPLISHALLETWRRRQGLTLTVAAYEAAGGIHDAIAHTAEAVYTDLDTAQREVAKQIFLRLTALGEGTEDTKRRLLRRELDAEDADTTLVLERLADARLLALDRDGVDIAHEALIRCWPRLRDWLAEDREGLRVHRHLTETTDSWEKLDHDPGTLYRGTRLGLAKEWAATAHTSLTPREQAFLDESLAAEAAEVAAVRRRTKRLRRLVALLGVLLVLAGVATFAAFRAQQTATEERNTALARKVADDATAIRAMNPALATQLSLAAYQLAPVPEARDGLFAALTTPYGARMDLRPDSAFHLAFSQDSRLLVTAGLLRSVRLWDVSDPLRPRPLSTLPGTDDTRKPIALSPDGRLLATGTSTGAVKLWDISNPAAPVQLGVANGHGKLVFGLAFSRDGRTLATGSTDTTIGLWNVTNPRLPVLTGRISHHTNNVNSLSFSPDGNMLVSGSDDKAVAIWDISDQAAPRNLSGFTGHTDVVTWVELSPDGRTLATSSWDRTTRLWDVTAPREPKPLATITAQKAAIWSARFSADGTRLTTSSDDGTVYIWDVAIPTAPKRLAVVDSKDGGVTSAALSPDGRTVAAVGDQSVHLQALADLVLDAYQSSTISGVTADGRMMVTDDGSGRVGRLWEIGDPLHPRELGKVSTEDEEITSIAVSGDGRALAVGSITHRPAGRLRLFDITDPRAPRLLAVTDTVPVYGMRFSPDGRTLATGHDAENVRLWDLTGTNRLDSLATLATPKDTVWAIRFSPDGRTLLASTGDLDPGIRIWSIAEPRQPRELTTIVNQENKNNGFYRMDLSPDGRTLAVTSSDRKVHLWDLADPAKPRERPPIVGGTEGAGTVAFSPDGTKLALSLQSEAQLWDLTDPDAPVRVAGVRTPDGISGVHFSPDGHTIAIGTAKPSVFLWETDLGKVSRRICALAEPKITTAEWDRYFPGVSYKPPCP
ncbi:WD40 repeat [Amycolatopsis xylanica]|uniref:WD40 repeat n=1 Tax=Amycolatopsis xylanica TaxID=589385 RepID=A0A1H3F044_9PSEU|nr:WD40 repeat domain-containing protein [Amycolatopsis xylanica]SDX84177.1 WD40 repeat [Amycolatopsis xylanica]